MSEEQTWSGITDELLEKRHDLWQNLAERGGLNTAAAYKPTKSKRRCAFCPSRACYERVVTQDMLFDELACRKHVSDLHKLSDTHLPGVRKMFITSTGYLERGVPEFSELETAVSEED